MRFKPSGIMQHLLKTLGLGLLISNLILGSPPRTTPQYGSTSVVSGSNNQYLVEFSGNTLPKDLAVRIAGLGGRVVHSIPEIGVALVAGLTPGSADSLASQTDVISVTVDDFVTYSDKELKIPNARAVEPRPSSASDPESAVFYPFQWDKRAIHADRAWEAGFHGSPDVRLAMIDTGMDPTHPELAGLIDTSSSISLCPNETPLVQQEFPGYPDWTDLYGHGTATAAVASSNSNLLAGVTSRTTLIAVKALGIVPCRVSSVLVGIIYAAQHGADVINVSAGAFPISRPGSRNFIHIDHLAMVYALQHGVSAIVVAAGNEAADLDHSGNLVQELCDVPGVICVSATGPTNSGPDYIGPFANVDSSSFYTNFGASAIDVAAPGGNLSFDNAGNIIGDSYVFTACATTDREFNSAGNLIPGFCTSNGITTAGWIGTSFSAPEVSGLAALLVSRFGHGQAAQVRAAIENSADDIGKPGVDPFYGKGRINVGRALGLR